MAIMYHNLYRSAGDHTSAVPDRSSREQSSSPIISPPPYERNLDCCHLYELPNELILHILSLLSTNDLLPLAPVSHRLHALTVRLLHARLSQATRLSDALILECYPPSQKLTAPALDCVYSHTPGIDTCLSSEPSQPAGQLSALHSLYCRFNPQRREWRRFSRPGDIPGSRTHATSAAVAQSRWQTERQQEVVKQMLSLEGHELFVQLEGNLHLVRQMGFIQNLVPVHEGYVRIWRDWLGQRAEADAVAEMGKGGLVEVEEVEAGPSLRGVGVSEVPMQDLENVHEHESILWLDGSKNVGLRVNVREKKWRRHMPILVYADEEISVSYEVVYEELLVRTAHLVFTLEKSARLEDTNSGKAVVFGTLR